MTLGVVVVGASVAGVAVVDTLRDQGYRDAVTLIDAEPGLPYDKPPLSKKALLAGWSRDAAELRPAAFYSDRDVTLLTGTTAVSLDPQTRTVCLSDGSEVTGDHVVLATGARARTLDPGTMRPGVQCIRTAEDSLSLRASLRPGSRLVVIGAGFIGAEVASTAIAEGAQVTIVDLASLPAGQIFGTAVAGALRDRHVARGIALRYGVGVVDVIDATEPGWAFTVQLEDGTALPADVVVVGLGAVPNTEWLHGAELDVEGGVRCDEYGRTSAPGVSAVGDVASWWHPERGEHVRHEHWTTAKEQAVTVACRIALPDEPPRCTKGLPYFWSDQHGTRLQLLGDTSRFDATAVVHGDLDRDFVVLYGHRGRLVAALGVGATREVMRYRPALTEGAEWSELVGSLSTPHEEQV